ncbi:exodeoxyribonuclease VII small subunit [Abyssisolibacter fermentans]|uniref:exodeoxyribonuclease VII small subunit n=1 Tax=Abyssisolibacter fermentans TaxID=1766203 RepID=UPI00082E51ED|nr:exodeoxyribonuclease VII small subunit [Abyssisolibacter fermentans]
MNNKEIKFEEALNRLKEITKKLEDNNLEIDDSLKYFEEGVRLYKYCREKLNNVDGKVKLILEQNDDVIKEMDFTDGE